MAPTILFVPGFWEGSAPFSDVASLLQAQGYPTEIATLRSTGTALPGNPSMKDDIDAIRSTVGKIVDKGQHVEPGALRCRTPETLLFNDLDEEAAKGWAKKLQSQPASDWEGRVVYCGWRDISSVYLVCEGDQYMKPINQLLSALGTKSKIEKCAAGHMPMISMPEKVVEVIAMAAQA
ncbi:hypothetical protein JMJ35_010534 [Cladonia borealis]|uniref:AB hydrolase-1 domain-containing protein n=1 Tax=Cladonia borealis TaxID=184061 RepID=A0AA39QRH3_9LECA|nr:hypothetical protein JMJ35_010534 [Cladonia borealis]